MRRAPARPRGDLCPRIAESGPPDRYDERVIFKAVRDSAPYPDHGVTRQREWSTIAPRQIRLDQLTTTRSTLDLRNLLDDDSTFFGDLFAHVVSYRGELYLETGLHRALRAALQGRTFIHARVLELGESGVALLAPLPPETGGNSTRNRRS